MFPGGNKHIGSSTAANATSERHRCFVIMSKHNGTKRVLKSNATLPDSTAIC